MIDCITYRHKGQSKSDNNLYRTKEEIEDWKTQDPLGLLQRKLLEQGTLTREHVDVIIEEVDNSACSAITEAFRPPKAPTL